DWKFYDSDGQTLVQTEYYYDDTPAYVYITKYSSLTGKKYFEGGNIEIDFQDFKIFRRAGPTVFYYKNSDIVEKAMEYKQGLLHGGYKYYDSATRNKIIEGNFEEGRREGLWRIFDPYNGQVLQEVNFHYGVPHGTIRQFDSSG